MVQDRSLNEMSVDELRAEVRRLREDAARVENVLSATRLDRDRFQTQSLRWEKRVHEVAADRDRLAQELERRNVAHVEPAIIAKDRDDWKACAERLTQQVNDLTEQLQSMIEQAQREAVPLGESDNVLDVLRNANSVFQDAIVGLKLGAENLSEDLTGARMECHQLRNKNVALERELERVRAEMADMRKAARQKAAKRRK